MTAAIALWNTVYLDRALEILRRRGDPVPDALLAHLAPLGWQHINLTGPNITAAVAHAMDATLRPAPFNLAQLEPSPAATTVPTDVLRGNDQQVTVRR